MDGRGRSCPLAYRYRPEALAGPAGLEADTLYIADHRRQPGRGPRAALHNNNGTPVTNLRVAVTQRIQQDGEWRDGDTSFYRITAWRQLAEHLVPAPSPDSPELVPAA
jgi:hypothetical protein